MFVWNPQVLYLHEPKLQIQNSVPQISKLWWSKQTIGIHFTLQKRYKYLPNA